MNTPVRAGLRVQRLKASLADLAEAMTVDLAVLARGENAARCVLLPSGHAVTLRSGRLWEAPPGAIATVAVAKTWSHRGHPYLSGEIVDIRIDVPALGLPPLALAAAPAGPDGRASTRGEQAFELARIVPGVQPGEPPDAPLWEVEDLIEAGCRAEAYRLLMDLCGADLRCLDAHAGLGDFVFGLTPREAVGHYEVGWRLGEHALPAGFAGCLPWTLPGNRGFLRCLAGHARCLWRLGRLAEGAAGFERLLALDPTDPLGAGVDLACLKAGGHREERDRPGAGPGRR